MRSAIAQIVKGNHGVKLTTYDDMRKSTFHYFIHFPWNDCLNAVEARLEEICLNPMIHMKIHKAVTPERISRNV